MIGMTKKSLASQLRARMIHRNELNMPLNEWTVLVNVLSDDDIIGSYITCNCCATPEAGADMIDQSIDNAHNVESWFDILDSYHRAVRNLQIGRDMISGDSKS